MYAHFWLIPRKSTFYKPEQLKKGKLLYHSSFIPFTAENTEA